MGFHIIYISFSLGTVYHNHKHGCQKCTVDGIFSNRRMSFPHTDCPLRTDKSFRERQEPDHHRGYSILEELPIDMVKDFITSDALHLLELGVMRRLLNIWKSGLPNFAKWSRADISIMDNMLEQLNHNLPKEIHRRMRPIDRLSFWKGTEFRTMLLYIGIVLFKGTLSPEIYAHFLMLFAATTICSTKAYQQFLPLAEILYNDYIELTIEYYGMDSIVSNIHNLCHIKNEVDRFGDLTTLTAYPFENSLRLIKLKLKTCNKVLMQAARRIVESRNSYLNRNLPEKDNSQSMKYPFKLPNGNEAFKELIIKNRMTLSSKTKGDMWFMIKSGNQICQFNYVNVIDDEIVIVSSSLHSKTDFFEKPFHSSKIFVYKSNGAKEDCNVLCSISDVRCKLVCLSFGEEIALLPLLHTLS